MPAFRLRQERDSDEENRMRRAVMGSLAVGALVSLLVSRA